MDWQKKKKKKEEYLSRSERGGWDGVEMRNMLERVKEQEIKGDGVLQNERRDM